MHTDGFDRAGALGDPASVMASKDPDEALIMSLLHVGVVGNMAHLARVILGARYLQRASQFKGMKWCQAKFRRLRSIRGLIERAALDIVCAGGRVGSNPGAGVARTAGAGNAAPVDGSGEDGVPQRSMAEKRRLLQLSVSIDKAGGRKRRRLLGSEDGSRLRTARDLEHVPVQRSKGICYQCGYTYSAPEPTNDGTIQRVRHQVGRQCRQGCSLCRVNVCMQCWGAFHRGEPTAYELHHNEAVL